MPENVVNHPNGGLKIGKNMIHLLGGTLLLDTPKWIFFYISHENLHEISLSNHYVPLNQDLNRHAFFPMTTTIFPSQIHLPLGSQQEEFDGRPLSWGEPYMEDPHSWRVHKGKSNFIIKLDDLGVPPFMETPICQDEVELCQL